MRKPAPENLNVASQQHSHADHSVVGADGTIHAHQAHATHVHDASMNASAYGGVVAGEIGAEAAVHGEDSSGMSAGSVAMTAAAAASPSPSSSSLQQLNEQREERTKKSVAYRHTGFHRLMLDNFGKEYEKRICSYCTAVFSFKGGTTSAALRHLKTTHPERLVYSGVSMSMPQQQQQLQLQLQHQLQEQQPPEQQQQQQDEPLDQEQQQQQQQQHYGGGIEEAVAHDETVREAETVQVQHSSDEEQVEQQETESEPDQTSPLDAEQGFEGGGGVDSSGGAAPPQFVDPPPVALHESGQEEVAVLVADGSTEQDDANAKEDDGEVLSQDMQMRPQTKVRQQAKRKRQQRDDSDSGRSRGGGGGDHSSHSFGAGVGGKYAPPLSASQSAITHFLHHYKEMLSLPNRLRFVKHLTYHPSEAEMYNVLDEATQMEYVREFSDDATTI